MWGGAGAYTEPTLSNPRQKSRVSTNQSAKMRKKRKKLSDESVRKALYTGRNQHTYPHGLSTSKYRIAMPNVPPALSGRAAKYAIAPSRFSTSAPTCAKKGKKELLEIWEIMGV